MTYDRLDSHVDSAIEAGQPPANAFTHIGLYLAWMIRHDLHDLGFFPALHVEAVKAGEMTGSDLADDIDGKLVGAMMTAEGRAFSDTNYGAYTVLFEEVFANEPPYSITDDKAARDRMEPALNGLYADWIAAGRPAPPLDADGFEVLDDGAFAAEFDAATLEINVADLPQPHAAPELEALIPAGLTNPPMAISSISGSQWSSSLMRRSLKRLGVRPADVRIANALGGSGDETLVVMLTGVPGADQERLLAEFRSVIFLPRGSWETRVVGGRTVEWTTAPEFSTAFWTNDGLVVQVSGREDLVEVAIPRLP